jgi:exodeoxyribonuclease-3
MKTKSIVTWSIQHGGGSTARGQGIIDQLELSDADAIVLTEFRNNSVGARIKAKLSSLGYSVSHPPVPEKLNSVVVGSRSPILAAHPLDPTLDDQRHFWVVALGWIKLCAVYMPLNIKKLLYWEAVIASSRSNDAPDLFIGDFNTGNNRIDLAEGASRFTAAHVFDDFGQGRFKDAWRSLNPEAREYTWFSTQRNNGFRLDHAFASELVFSRVSSCCYLHELRTCGLSDHSAMRVEIADENRASLRLSERGRSKFNDQR